MLSRYIFAAFAALCGIFQSAMAGPSHHHGEADLIVEIEEGSVSISFQADLLDLVGFEDAPATPDQDVAIKTLHDDLMQGDALISFSPSAECDLTSATTEGGYRMIAGRIAPKDATHVVFASWTWACDTRAFPQSFALNIFKKWAQIEKVDALVFRNGEQSVSKLTRAKATLKIR